MTDFDTTLLQWATPLEAEALRAGSAEALGISEDSYRQRLLRVKLKAARSGYSPRHDQTHVVPPGQHIRGVSTLYKGDGTVAMQWVKSAKDVEDKLTAIREAMADMVAEYTGVAAPVAPPEGAVDEDYLAVYPLGDPHVGMVSWAPETGTSYDLKIAEQDICGVVDRLVSIAPPTSRALVIDMGDFFHTDDSSNRTFASKHVLDVDSRYAKMCSVGLRIKRRVVDRVLQRHQHVTLWNRQGNHDQHTSLMLGAAMAAIYEREPRLTVSQEPSQFDVMRFGQCLIAATHGHTVRAGARLPQLLAARYPQLWGATQWRVWYTGHVHHESVKEFPGCLVETVRALAPKDGWAHAAGFESERDLRCDLWHREKGRTTRLSERV